MNALTVRMPCSDSCMVSMMSAVPVNWLCARPLMRFTSLRSTSIAGGATAKPSSAIIGILHQHHDDERDQRQQIAPDRVDQQVEHLRDRGGAGGQPRQKFRRMPLGEEARCFRSSAWRTAARWLLARIALPICDRITVWP